MPLPLPHIEECLFGTTRKCPRIPVTTEASALNASNSSMSDDGFDLTMENDDDDEANVLHPFPPTDFHPNDDIDTNSGTDNHDDDDDNDDDDPDKASGYDNIYAGHWGQAAEQHDINLKQLRKICNQGILDEGSPRAVAWRVLLDYLPPNNISKSWPKTLPRKRHLYRQLVAQFFEGTLDPGKELRGKLSKRLRDRKLRKKYDRLQRLDESADHLNMSSDDDDDELGFDTDEEDDSGLDSNSDHPSASIPSSIEHKLPHRFKERWRKAGIELRSASLANARKLGVNVLKIPITQDSTNAEFQAFLEDARLLETIRKDASRTHPHLFFYLETEHNLGKRRYAALERILFIWAKLNGGFQYVQGMNEIVGTIYYVLANDHNSEWVNYAEPDTYYLFHKLMMDVKDVFNPDMDTHSKGIHGRMGNLEQLLKIHDPAVYEHLQNLGIDSSFYAFRWLTTLLSREFLLPDTIRLWDSLFSSTHKENFLRYVCGTMVMMVRDELLLGDFASCLRLLQRYPPSNVESILESSRSLWIYECQITSACQKGGMNMKEALQSVPPLPAVIMAYGLRGGLATSSPSEASKTTARQQSTSSEGSLLGRLWGNWGSSSLASEQPSSTAPPPVPAATPLTTAVNSTGSATTTPQRSRFWNRSRSNTHDSSTSAGTSSVKEVVTTPSSTPTKRSLWAAWSSESQPSLPDLPATTAEAAAVAATSAPPAAATAMTPTKAPAAAAETASITPSRRPIWKGAPSRAMAPARSNQSPARYQQFTLKNGM
eukprot:Nitzschia sp. Nitz4//scaffold37_size175936//23829//26241//NITZ4_002027-RA/size175936-augustus-gene-0.4-mRNA-1//1//CDS//3329549731//8796//frame0